MHFASTLHARKKGFRTLANHFPDSRSLPYDEAIGKGQDMPFNCHRASSCPEIVIQPWSFNHPSEEQLAHSLTGASRRTLGPGGHKVPVHDSQRLSACFPRVQSTQIVHFPTFSWTSSTTCTVRRHSITSSSCLYVFKC